MLCLQKSVWLVLLGRNCLISDQLRDKSTGAFSVWAKAPSNCFKTGQQRIDLKRQYHLVIQLQLKLLFIIPFIYQCTMFHFPFPFPFPFISWITIAVVRTHGIVTVSVDITVIAQDCALVNILERTRVKYLHGIPWKSMEFHDTPMEYPWSIHGVPWNAMEFHGVSMEFHGMPWSSMEYPWSSMEYPWRSMECHGVSWSTDAAPWNAIACPWSSIEYHAVSMRKSIEIQ